MNNIKNSKLLQIEPRKRATGSIYYPSEGVIEFNKQLETAARIFNESDENQIDGILHALVTARELIAKISPTNFRILFRLELALRGLENGTVERFLKPTRNGRPKAAYNVELAKALAAAAVTFYIAAGKTKSDSASKVAHKIRGWDFSIRGDKLTKDTIINWRKGFIEFHNPDSLGQETYDFLISDFENHNCSFENYAEDLINSPPNPI